MSPDTWYPHKSPTDQFKGYFKGCTLHCIQIFWYFLDGKNVVRSIHYEHAAYNMLPRNIYAAAHNMLPRELNIPIIKSNTWPREPLPNQLTRKLGALELISPFWMWEQEKQMNKKMKRDNSTKSQHQVLDKCLRGISSFIKNGHLMPTWLCLQWLTRGVRSYAQCGCNVLAKFWRLEGCSKRLDW